MSGIEEVDPETVKGWIDAGEAVVIDVREELEYVPEHIEGAHWVPLSRFSVDAVPDQANKRLVFYCQGGVRSLKTSKMWQEVNSDGVAYNMTGGLARWKRENLPVQRQLASEEEYIRQFYILCGGLFIALATLSAFFFPAALLLQGVVGAAMVAIGIKEPALMKMLLSKVLKI